VRELGGTVAGLAFAIELTELGGRGRLGGYEVESVVRY
jgi:adenine phosphoribosyltransferase